ncbi:hypothetical protein KO527_16035 [Pseudoalteromonas sp. C2R02]|uniref:hypothetical protein n=1 Tax=Pseudoalteromonas sp. C2R02 TaxID=2841565 RepID=UPI001C085FE4|nr:hypothetical protein [Pseudoalteromonas sp. C2R02]MBU2970862.1 hypothetical protein [Pseudoalteromonas sp. C2R02]
MIPTLKGGDFNNQYEIHDNFRYLDFATMSFIIGFVWLGVNVGLQHHKRKVIIQTKQ